MYIEEDGLLGMVASRADMVWPSHYANLYVDETDVGMGVFAARDLAPCSWILSFEGQLINMDHPLARLDEDGVLLQVGRSTYLMPRLPAALLNHSCEPNAGLFKDTHLVAIRRIAKGEQICFDYSTTMHENNWTLECACGTPSCRGVVEDFKTLSPELQEKYRGMGVVSSFVPE